MTSNIKRVGARNFLAIGEVNAFVRNRGSNGLEFCFDINDPIKDRKVTVAIFHIDRDRLIEGWAKLEQQFEGQPALINDSRTDGVSTPHQPIKPPLADVKP